MSEPVSDFTKFGLHQGLLRGVRELGFATPTPIQAQAIPPALSGGDVLACAMTGTGKTAAFGLPILHRLIGKPRGTTRALILTPTRELAAQVQEHLRALALFTGLRSAAVFGGVAMGPQQRAFREGVDILVATPGRLLDHMRERYADLSGLEILVLDEADRMLDMGFLPDIRRVLARIPAQRQTLFFSATMPEPIVRLTKELLVAPKAIQIARKPAPATGVTQAIYPVAQELKTALLRELLAREPMRRVLVFTRTKHRANRVTQFLSRNGIACAAIHGNRSQTQRMQALAQFRAGQIRALVATDIAARGIDVDALSHVVNFDVPGAPEDYIHRVGRTARAEAIGDAFTFVAPAEEPTLRDIERAIGKKLPRVVLQGFDYAARPSEKLEIPIGERIAEIRARKQDERTRRAAREARAAGSPPPRHARAERPVHRSEQRPGAAEHRAAEHRGNDHRAAEHRAAGPGAGPSAGPRRQGHGHWKPRSKAAAKPAGISNGFVPRRRDGQRSEA